MGSFRLIRITGNIFPIAPMEISKFDEAANYRSTLESELSDAMDILTALTPTENEAAAVGEFRKRTAVFTKIFTWKVHLLQSNREPVIYKRWSEDLSLLLKSIQP